MARRVCRWLVLAVLLAAGCGRGAGVDQGLILCQAAGGAQAGASAELVVIAPDGKELRRIDLPDAVQAISPLGGAYRAMVRTAAGRMFLVDAGKGTAREVELPAEARGNVGSNVPQFLFAGGGKRWYLLGNPGGKLAYLIDLETGRVTDLITVGEGIRFVFSGRFSPVEDYLAVVTDAGLWLLPTADPGRARRLGQIEQPRGVVFSEDGRLVAYLQGGVGQMEVVVERVDGSGAQTVATGNWFETATFVPGQGELLLVREDRLSLLALAGGQERDLLSFQGRYLFHRFAPNGKRLLLGHHDEAAGKDLWTLVDLETGTGRPLDALTEYTPYLRAWDPGHRWVPFVDSVVLGGAHQVMSLDLDSAETRPVLALGAETGWWGVVDATADGRLSLAYAQDKEEGQMRLWLLRMDRGESRLLAEGTLVGGAFSPDGDWVTVSTVERQGEQEKVTLVLLDTEGGESKPLGEGLRPAWVRP